VLDITRELRSGRRPAGRPQDNRQRHYHRLPTPQEFQAFRDLGFRLVAYADYEELLEPYRGAPSDLSGALGAATAARLPA
jgi:hypothetical protein